MRTMLVYTLGHEPGKNEVCLSDLPEPNWASYSDVDFIAFISLRRVSSPHERWRSLPVRAAKQAIRSLKEFYDYNVLNASTILEEHDFHVRYDDTFLGRAYQLLLDRTPTSGELYFWKQLDTIGLALLTQKLFLSDEAFAVDGISEELGLREPEIMLARQIAINQQNHDSYIQGCIESSSLKSASTKKLSRLPSDGLKIGFNFFGMSDADKLKFKKALNAIHPNISIETVVMSTDDIIDKNSLETIDIILMNNNNLYHRTNELLEKVAAAKCVTCCWLWDNHHQYQLSLAVVQVFDVVFPAHSNGQTYLHNGRAIVGPITPCSVFQWSSDATDIFFQKALTAQRSDALYGRFNSYPGRLGFRDQFLRKVQAEIEGTGVKVVRPDENNWFQNEPEARYVDLAGFKAVLCNPIFNDVPARVFDAIIAGCVPVVPYGLPDIHFSFDATEIAGLPIISYIPGSIESLKSATMMACKAFDELGIDGIIRRYQLAKNHHIVYVRVSSMVSELIKLQAIAGHS